MPATKSRKSARNTSGPITLALINEIAELTDQNHATDAVTVLARALDMPREVTALDALRVLNWYLQDMPLELIAIRTEIRKKALAKAKRMVDDATYRRLDAAF